MDKKRLIRKNYIVKRKKYYFSIDSNFFKPLIDLIKKKKFKKKPKISLYFPTLNETNVLKILDNDYFKNFIFLLPVIERENNMNFYSWKKNDILSINKYGILEPIKTKRIIPDIILVPLLAFDKNKNRLGYGKGFYDKFLNKYVKTHQSILSVGIAFSFQKHHNLPNNNKDFKLDFVITEKGIVKWIF